MEISIKKLKNGFELPVLGLGTWKMGGEREIDTTNDQKEIQAIKDAIKLGITHIDTAEMYGKGHSEELLGLAIQDINRTKIFITTKVYPTHLAYNDLISSAKNSLKRLKTSPDKKVAIGLMAYNHLTGGIKKVINSPQMKTHLEFLKSIS